MGSVKDLSVLENATTDSLGIGVFNFSDRYSVFDWGEMPDLIPNKGAALAMMAAWNFEAMDRARIPTHYIGMLNGDGELVSVEHLTEPSSRVQVTLSPVVRPEFRDGGYDYSWFMQNRGRVHAVVPLEVIYRRGAPQGSSLFKKMDKIEGEQGIAGLKKFLEQFGLTERPYPGDMFPIMGYDFTTKFEKRDRPLDGGQAFTISGLNPEQFAELCRIRNAAVGIISGRAKDVGLIDYDGKLEFRVYDGVVAVADVAGTFDENRFMTDVDGRQVQVSKEFLRQFYKKTQSAWVRDIERAKIEADQLGIEDWKSLVRVQPMPLPRELPGLVGEMYASGANKYVGRRIFREARPLERVMIDLMPYIENVA